MGRKTNIIIAILVLLSISACSGFGTSNNNQYNSRYDKYFEGYDSVEAVFENFPQRLYYYDGNPEDVGNNFDFSVRVNNDGSSFTRGAVFISGFSPNLVKIDQIPIGTTNRGACTLRLNSFSLNRLGAMFQCGDDFSWSGHEEADGNWNWLDSIKFSGKTWFENNPLFSDLIVNYQNTNQGGDFQMSWEGLDYIHREHGQLLIALLAGLNFEVLHGQEFLLAGDTYDYPGGELDYIDYNGRITNWPQGLDESRQRFMLTTCYLYTTFVAEDVCIDPQPYSDTRKVCSPKVSTYSKGQGAPIAITRVEQENTPTKSLFRFTVENKGGGTLFEPGHIEKCSPYHIERTSPSDLNIVWLGEVRIGNTPLDCNPQTYIKLDPRTNRGTFTCTYGIEYAALKSAYVDTLTTELWYGYSKAYEKDLLITRVQ